MNVTPLGAKDKIVAIAQLAGAKARSKEITVQSLPAGLTPTLHIPLYIGGHCITVSNRMPRGALIETHSGATRLGSSSYFYPSFHQRLVGDLKSNDVVHVSSDICTRALGSWPITSRRCMTCSFARCGFALT